MSHPLNRTTCEEAFRRLDDFLDRRLARTEMHLIEEHLEICAACAREFTFEASVLDGGAAEAASAQRAARPDGPYRREDPRGGGARRRLVTHAGAPGAAAPRAARRPGPIRQQLVRQVVQRVTQRDHVDRGGAEQLQSVEPARPRETRAPRDHRLRQQRGREVRLRRARRRLALRT